ncbi:L-seryl-tRNA(Sec) kinase-like [Lineus longissimus]|uniref:L-seryl-tRNA(Sec) kinase-like n=1 Tax=Lineus longissimus TaxID=88925 RepID=UPI002B4F9B5C
MMPKICILVLSGFPASGKTTLAKGLCEHLSLRCPEYVTYHVCYDAILSTDVEQKLLEITGKVDSSKPSQWKEYRKKIVKCVDHLITMRQGVEMDIFDLNFIDIDYLVMEKFRKFIGLEIEAMDPNRMMEVDGEDPDNENKYLILIDDNMYYRSMRYEYYQMAKKYKCGFAQLCLQCSIETTLRRNIQRTMRVPDDVIINMASRFEPPDPTSNSWESNSMLWDSDMGGNLWDVLYLIERAMENPVLPPPAENSDTKLVAQAICSTNLLHQSDQVLRKLVSIKMSQAKDSGQLTKNDMKSLASSLNHMRSKLLDELKAGKILIPDGCSQTKDASKNPNSLLFRYLTDIFGHWQGR